MKVLPDTNTATAVGARDSDFVGLRHFLQGSDRRLVLAPPIIAELLVKILNGGDSYFQKNKRALVRLMSFSPDILELPASFARVMFHGPHVSINGVRPFHYLRLLNALESSTSKCKFIARANDLSVGWARIQDLPQIHNSVVSTELEALQHLASQKFKRTFGEKVADSLAVGAAKPHPNDVSRAFSAAFEYLQANIVKVKGGARPDKNDRGVWVDYNILWYLADQEITIITSERFQKTITNSPQVSRIIQPPWATKKS